MTTMVLSAIGASLAIIAGVLLPRWFPPSTLTSSIVLGFAAGAMTGTVSFEIVPEALRLAPLPVVALGFTVGFGLVYALDLGIHQGRTAGEHAAQHSMVADAHARRHPLGGPATVLAGAALFEAAVEGISLGVGSAIGAGLTVPLAIAIAVDNLGEGLSLGTLAEARDMTASRRRVLWWAIGIALMTVATAFFGWFALSGASPVLHAAVFAAGGGGMLYLTVTELVPEAEAIHYQQSAAVATALGFLTLLILSEIH